MSLSLGSFWKMEGMHGSPLYTCAHTNDHTPPSLFFGLTESWVDSLWPGPGAGRQLSPGNGFHPS